MTASARQLLDAERRARALLQREGVRADDEWTFVQGNDEDGLAVAAAARLAARQGAVAALRAAPDGGSSSAWRLLRGGREYSPPLPGPDDAWRLRLEDSSGWVERAGAEHPVLTCAQCREIDGKAIDDMGVPGICLMENAAVGATAVAMDMLRGAASPRVAILAGGGNNGGDGLAMARGFAGLGVCVDVALLKPSESLRGDAGINLALLRECGVRVHAYQERPEALDNFLRGADLVVDGLLGTGFKGGLSPAFRVAIDAVNAADIPVLALDLPSGLDGDTGAVAEAAVRAARTATFAALKTGLAGDRAAEWAGELFLVDIGAPNEAYPGGERMND